MRINLPFSTILPISFSKLLIFKSFSTQPVPLALALPHSSCHQSCQYLYLVWFDHDTPPSPLLVSSSPSSLLSSLFFFFFSLLLHIWSSKSCTVPSSPSHFKRTSHKKPSELSVHAAKASVDHLFGEPNLTHYSHPKLHKLIFSAAFLPRLLSVIACLPAKTYHSVLHGRFHCRRTTVIRA